MISDPVETPFGFHLIMVTDRKEGKPVDFEQNKPYILQEFGNELQKNVVNAERQRAKIDIKPMPKDLFPSQAPAAPCDRRRARHPRAKARRRHCRSRDRRLSYRSDRSSCSAVAQGDEAVISLGDPVAQRRARDRAERASPGGCRRETARSAAAGRRG